MSFKHLRLEDVALGEINDPGYEDKIFYRDFISDYQMVKIRGWSSLGFPLINIYMSTYKTWKEIKTPWKYGLYQEVK